MELCDTTVRDFFCATVNELAGKASVFAILNIPRHDSVKLPVGRHDARASRSR
jgi:hypothetical protein